VSFDVWLETTKRPLPTVEGGGVVDVWAALRIYVDEQNETLRQAVARRSKNNKWK